jgi:hypothetical protein
MSCSCNPRLELPTLRLRYERICTYRCGEFGRLSGLPALLTNWRQRRTEGGNVVRGEATVQLAAAIARGTDLGANGVTESERFFARGAKAPIACRIGHLDLEIHCTRVISTNILHHALSVGLGLGGVGRRGGREAGHMTRHAAPGAVVGDSTYTITLTRGEGLQWPRWCKVSRERRRKI